MAEIRLKNFDDELYDEFSKIAKERGWLKIAALRVIIEKALEDFIKRNKEKRHA